MRVVKRYTLPDYNNYDPHEIDTWILTKLFTNYSWRSCLCGWFETKSEFLEGLTTGAHTLFCYTTPDGRYGFKIDFQSDLNPEMVLLLLVK